MALNGESLVLLEAEEGDDTQASDTGNSDDEDGKLPLPSLRLVSREEDEEHDTVLESPVK